MTARILLVLWAVALVGCPKGGQQGPVGPGTGGGGTQASGDAGAVAKAPDAGAPCADRARCMFHPGAGAHFTCYNAADGACAHYGPTCAPKDQCLFVPEQNAYRKCDRVIMGRCASAASEACVPADRCMFDPEAGIYRTCTEPTEAGTCETFTDPC